MLVCCLLSIQTLAWWPLLFDERASRLEHRYFLFLLFLGLGWAICLWVDQSAHIVLEKPITLSVLGRGRKRARAQGVSSGDRRKAAARQSGVGVR